MYNENCYPTLFDIHMVDSDGDFVTHGCSFLADPKKPVFLGGQELYNPDTFQPGSSYSHHDGPGFSSTRCPL